MKNIWILSLLVLAACSGSGDAERANSSEEGQELSQQETNVQKQYYPNGNLMVTIELRDGKREGVSKKYYEDGTVNTSIEYKNDLREGEAKFYYQGGELYRFSTYKNNMLNGTRKFFHRGEELKSEQTFLNDFPGNDLLEYSNLGQLRDEKYKLTGSLRKAKSGSLLTASINKNPEKTSFYIGELIDGKYMHEGLREITTGSSQIDVVLNPEEIAMPNLAVIAKIQSRYKNDIVLSQSLK